MIRPNFKLNGLQLNFKLYTDNDVITSPVKLFPFFSSDVRVIWLSGKKCPQTRIRRRPASNYSQLVNIKHWSECTPSSIGTIEKQARVNENEARNTPKCGLPHGLVRPSSSSNLSVVHHNSRLLREHSSNRLSKLKWIFRGTKIRNFG